MTTSVSVPAAKLREMLAAVIPHAGDEDSLPLLNAVQFEVRAGTLFLIATDRYTIAIARCVIPGADAAPVQYAAANLMLAEAREMHHILERSDAVAALAFGDDDLRLDTGAGGSASWTLTPGADYPDWRDLMRDMLAGEPAQLGGKRGLSPLHLGKFALLLGSGDDRQRCEAPLRVRILSPAHRRGVPLHSGEREPVVLLARGDWFLGALMPIRLDWDAAPEGDPWAGWAAVTAPAEAALAGPEAVSA